MELAVVGLAQVLHEIARPRTAEAAIGIKPRIDAQSLPRTDLNQGFTGLQRFEFVIVLDAWQVKPVNLFILAQQRLVRRTEHGVPSHPSNMMFAGFAGGGTL